MLYCGADSMLYCGAEKMDDSTVEKQFGQAVRLGAL
jgi:hypothetical protein